MRVPLSLFPCLPSLSHSLSARYDNVNSRASKILLAVDLWNFENNNKSNESVSFSFTLSYFSLSLLFFRPLPIQALGLVLLWP